MQAEGLEAVFECQYPGATNYSWAINGSFSTNFLEDVESSLAAGDSPSRLIIPATLRYNITVVQCEAVITEREGGVFVISCPAVLLVQGDTIQNYYAISTNISALFY